MITTSIWKYESEIWGKVVSLCLDKDGKVIGSPNENPYMNTAMYEVQFEDGTSQAYGANIIAENLWRSVNDEGYHEDIHRKKIRVAWY